MSISDVGQGFETLFNPTRIWLFGKRFRGLEYVPTEMDGWPKSAGLQEFRQGKVQDDTAAALAVAQVAKQTEEALAFVRSLQALPPASRPPGLQIRSTGVDPLVEWIEHLEEIRAKSLQEGKDVTQRLDDSLRKSSSSSGAWQGEFDKNYRPNDSGDLPMPPGRLERTLRRGMYVNANGEAYGEAKQFARIYSYTYEAHYYRLPRPLLFLLTGDGESVRSEGFRQRNPFSAAFTGVEAREWEFSYDIRVWTVDRKDLAVCLDVEIGNYQEILLDSMLGGGGGAASSRGDVAGRGAGSFRGDMAGSFRGDMAGSFRGDMIGPHQNKVR